MKVNQNYNSTQTLNSKQQSFGSAVDVVTQGLRYLNVNEAVGATLVDFSSMALPRTIVDSTRGLDAGIETGIRENSGTLNHVLIGTIGGMAAYALSTKFNKTYDVFAHSIFANNETIDILGKIWHDNYLSLKNAKGDERQKIFYRKAFESMSGLASNDGKSEKWVKLNSETIGELTEKLSKLSADTNLKGKRLPKETLNYFRNLIISDTGAEKTFKIVSNDKKTTVEFAISSFLDDLFALGRAFNSDKVLDAFSNARNDFTKNEFINNLKGLKVRSAAFALSISCAIGASVQPFNRWLTKKRTGNDGFVGVANNPNAESKKPESSKKFLLAKGIATASILGLALSSITTNIKELPNKIQFKGKIPTMNHFKLVYGVTLASRFLAARSSDELRESCIKDFLGFTNWLILGGFVSKGIATMFDSKSLLNAKGDGTGKGFMNWLKNKSVKTVDEVLQSDLQAANVKTVTDDGKAIPFKTLLEKARTMKLDCTLKKIKYLNIAQLGGYLYSGIILGYLIPKLNIKMTEMNNRKRKEQTVPAESSPAILDIEANAPQDMQSSPKLISSSAFSKFIK